jgi:hypothetical protein
MACAPNGSLRYRVAPWPLREDRGRDRTRCPWAGDTPSGGRGRTGQGRHLHDLSSLRNPVQEARAIAAEIQCTPMPFTGPLFKFALFQTWDDEFYLFACGHHIVIDGIGIALVGNRPARGRWFRSLARRQRTAGRTDRLGCSFSHRQHAPACLEGTQAVRRIRRGVSSPQLPPMPSPSAPDPIRGADPAPLPAAR